MNLEHAVSLSQLGVPMQKEVKPRKMSAAGVAKMILARCERNGYPYKHFPVNDVGAKAWAKKFLASKEFVLMHIDINAAASPHNPRDPKRVAHYLKCNAETFDPIVVDKNHRKQGGTLLGYVPEVIVADGKHRKAAMLAQGHTKILAWVGCRAAKRIKPQKMILASDGDKNTYLPPVKPDPSKIKTAYELSAATVVSTHPPMPRQDTGAGGSRPKDQVHGKHSKGVGHRMANPMMKNGKGKGHRFSNPQFEAQGEEMCACGGPGARSSGSIVPNASDGKVPPDASDNGSDVSASDQLGWNKDKPQLQAPGTHPGDSDQFGLNEAAAYQNNIGPRIVNKGAKNSEFSRALSAGGHSKNCNCAKCKKMQAATKVGKIWTKKKKGGK